MSTKSTLCLCVSLLGLAVIVSACKSEARQKTETVAPVVQESDMAWDNGYYHQDQVIEGMTYRVWFLASTRDTSSQTGYCIHSINLTKDKLEVELLKYRLGKKD